MRIDININGQPKKPNRGDWIACVVIVLFAVVALIVLVSGLRTL